MEPTSNKYSLGGQRPLRSRSPNKSNDSRDPYGKHEVRGSYRRSSPLRSGSPKFDRSYGTGGAGRAVAREGIHK